MATTYEPIATTTLGSAASSITFSSIAGTYTDLRVVFSGTATVSGALRCQFNSDSATNYSVTILYGDGTTAASQVITNQTYMNLSWARGIQTSTPMMATLDIFSYAGSTYKTALTQLSNDNNGAGATASTVGLWRSTSAITSITLFMSGTTFETGTTATLYGIKAA